MKVFISILASILVAMSVMAIGNHLFITHYGFEIATEEGQECFATMKQSDPHNVIEMLSEDFLIAEEVVVQTIEEQNNEAENIEATIYEFNEKEVEMLAKLVWGEAMGLNKLEQSAVIWCVLNRVDSTSRFFPDTIKAVILQQNQFSGYHKWCPVRDDIKELVIDVLTRWYMEKDGIEDVGRTLPKNYYYFRGIKNFRGYKRRNWFFTTEEYHKSKDERNYWDWSLPNPYEE